MSIIVDALERVQSERANQQQRPDEFLDTIAPQDDALTPLEETHPPREYRPPKKKTLFNKTNIIIALFVALFVSLGFLFNQDPLNNKIGEASHINPIISEDKKTTETINFKQQEDDFFNAIEEEFKDTLPIHEENQANKPIDTIPEPVVIIKPLPIIDASEPQKSLPSEPGPTIIQEKQETKPQTIEPIIKKTPVEIKTTIPPKLDWFTLGKIAFQKDGLLSAAPIWTKGFSSLPPNTPVISIMINRIPRLATDLLNTLHNDEIDAFTVEGLFKKELAYFTLALPLQNNLSETQNTMDRIERLIDGKPFKNTQKFIQKRIDKLKQPVNTTKTKPQIKAANKKIGNEARLDIAKKGIIKGQYHEAIKILRPVLFNAKDDWEVLFWIGSAKLGLGLYNEADDYFKKGLAINPNIAQLWTQRAIIAQERNDHINALKYLNRAQTIQPKSPETLLNIAYSSDALGDRNGAIFAYRDFLSLTNGNPQFSQQRRGVNQRLHELGL